MVLQHYLRKQETQKLGLFHLNAACSFVNKHTKHKNITWSQLNHPVTLYCQNDRMYAQKGAERT